MWNIERVPKRLKRSSMIYLLEIFKQRKLQKCSKLGSNWDFMDKINAAIAFYKVNTFYMVSGFYKLFLEKKYSMFPQVKQQKFHSSTTNIYRVMLIWILENFESSRY